MRLPLALAGAVATLAAGAAAADAPYRGPIIDVHLHSYPDRDWQQVPMAATTNFLTPEELTSNAPASAAAHRAATLAELKRLNVTTGLVSFDTPGGSLAEELALAKVWNAESGGRVRVGISEHSLVAGADARAVEAALRAGVVAQLSELGLQYHGMSVNDPKLEPYWALAEKLDVPVGIHMGAAAPESWRQWPKFRMALGRPLLLEDWLVRHPKLRVWFQHGGWPYLDETKAILEQYPDVRLDLSAIDWTLPPQEFRQYLKALVDAGFADRLMFGSDQMLWPQAIGKAIAAINEAPFLSVAQKQAILHDNAAKFFRIEGAK